MGKSIYPEEYIIGLYKELGNVWEVGKAIGRCGQSVHEYLQRRGVDTSKNIFTKQDDEYLKERYLKYRDEGKLPELALEMKRTKNFICRQARRLGFTAIKYKRSEKHNENMKLGAIGMWDRNEHPRGMSGKKHTDSVKAAISVSSKAVWKNPDYILNGAAYKQQMSDRMVKLRLSETNRSNNYTRTKYGWFEQGDKFYFMRSSWELNYACYLNHLIGTDTIISWTYEPDTFNFEEIKMGVRTYTPDFKVVMPDKSIIYHEVKGWMDEKSKLKLSRMELYFPNVNITLIDKYEYKKISKMSDQVKGWGTWITENPNKK